MKNNLQVVASLLKIQSGFVTDELSKEYFNISADRVRAMALIHQQLYRSDSLSQISFEYYLKDLVVHLFQLYSHHKDYVKLTSDVHGITMGIDTAVPCGLLVNEIVTNSLKHAFPNERKGEVKIDIKMDGENYVMKISDNGIGIPGNINFDEEKSMGVQLIKMLTEQLDAKVEINRDYGTEYIMTFKSQTYSKRV